MLGLPERFDLDPAVIEQAFFDKSKDLHADRFASAPAAERVAALSRSRALNDAYQVVKKPVARAEYLLARAGVTIGDNERVEPELLMEVLELREELAEAKGAGKVAVASVGSADERGDAQRRAATIEALRANMAGRRDAAVGALAQLFERADLAAIKKQLILLRYLDRYLEECDAALDAED